MSKIFILKKLFCSGSMLWNYLIAVKLYNCNFLKLKKEAWQPVSGQLDHSLCQSMFCQFFDSLQDIQAQFFKNLKKDGGLRKWRSSVFGVSAVLSDMEINLEFFAKVKAIKLHCCLGSGFISDRNDIASTWIGGNKITREKTVIFQIVQFWIVSRSAPPP